MHKTPARARWKSWRGYKCAQCCMWYQLAAFFFRFLFLFESPLESWVISLEFWRLSVQRKLRWGKNNLPNQQLHRFRGGEEKNSPSTPSKKNPQTFFISERRRPKKPWRHATNREAQLGLLWARRHETKADWTASAAANACLFIAEINDADVLEFSKVKNPFCRKKIFQNSDAKCSLGHYVCHRAGSGEWMICNNDVWPSSPFSGGGARGGRIPFPC